MVKKIIGFIILAALFFSGTSSAFAWNAVTHYHINNQNSGSYPYEDIFCANGTGPDMFVSVPLINPLPDYGEEGVTWADLAHCPNPKELPNGTRPFENKPNTGYLMYILAGKDSSSLAKAYSLGWEGHISADWVAHNENLFPISGDFLKSARHASGEALYDYYVFLTKGSIPLSLRFDPDLIYKALVNSEMISIHETLVGGHYKDHKLKAMALDQSLPKSTIKQCCRRWAGIVAAMQTAYILRSLQHNTRIPDFIRKMEAKGVEENLLLAENSVSNWLNAKTARGNIPDYSAQIIPFSFNPVACNMDMNQTRYGWLFAWLKGPFSNTSSFFSIRPAWAVESAEDPSQDSEGEQNCESADPDKITYDFWNEVAKQAESSGVIQYEEETLAEEGAEYIITPEVKDQAEFENILNGVIDCRIDNSSSDADKRYALFCQNFIQEGISDPDALIDTTAPTIYALSPEENSATPFHKPTISFKAIDNPSGIGLDYESVRMVIDGQPTETAQLQFIPELDLFLYQPNTYLPSGEHTVTIRVSDKAGNESERTSKFTVGTVFNHAIFSDGATTFKGCPKVYGDIYSKDTISLIGSPTLKGNIYTTATTIKKGKPAIEGFIYENFTAIAPPEVDFDYYKYLSQIQGRYIEGNKEFTPHDKPGGLIFVDGDVILNNACDGNSLDHSETTIICSGNILVLGDWNISSYEDGLALVAKNSIEISDQNNFSGVLYSLNGVIVLNGKSVCCGALTAKSGILITGSSSINYNPDLK